MYDDDDKRDDPTEAPEGGAPSNRPADEIRRSNPVVTLPSGAVAEFRPLTIADENFMADAKRSRKGRALDMALEQILDRCTVRVVSPGPYRFLSENGRPDWHRMLTGDRVEAMFALRKISYAEGYLYVVENVTCACGHAWDHEFDIDEDLLHQPLAEESQRKYAAGEPFAVEVGGCDVSFVLQSGETEDLYDKMRRNKPARKMAAGLRSRIVDVSGIERRDIMDWLDGDNGVSKRFPGLSSNDAEELRAAFDAVDCGVDTEVEAQCPECSRLVRFALPFDSIFVPGRKIRARKRARRGTEFSAR